MIVGVWRAWIVLRSGVCARSSRRPQISGDPDPAHVRSVVRSALGERAPGFAGTPAGSCSGVRPVLRASRRPCSLQTPQRPDADVDSAYRACCRRRARAASRLPASVPRRRRTASPTGVTALRAVRRLRTVDGSRSRSSCRVTVTPSFEPRIVPKHAPLVSTASTSRSSPSTRAG